MYSDIFFLFFTFEFLLPDVFVSGGSDELTSEFADVTIIKNKILKMLCYYKYINSPYVIFSKGYSLSSISSSILYFNYIFTII